MFKVVAGYSLFHNPETVTCNNFLLMNDSVLSHKTVLFWYARQN